MKSEGIAEDKLKIQLALCEMIENNFLIRYIHYVCNKLRLLTL